MLCLSIRCVPTCTATSTTTSSPSPRTTMLWCSRLGSLFPEMFVAGLVWLWESCQIQIQYFFFWWNKPCSPAWGQPRWHARPRLDRWGMIVRPVANKNWCLFHFNFVRAHSIFRRRWLLRSGRWSILVRRKNWSTLRRESHPMGTRKQDWPDRKPSVLGK